LSFDGPNYDDLDSECSDEINENQVDEYMSSELMQRIQAIKMKCSAYDPIEVDSFDGVEDGYI
jgi:hypothetical protein